MSFQLSSIFTPRGDQESAIRHLASSIKEGNRAQVLLGVTGSGKTFTIANVIAELSMPTLVIAHNKTLAGQLFQEFKDLFPRDHVEYFVSYYDYYQPEAYLPRSDTYIEKSLSINDKIDKMRTRATTSLVAYSNIIVIASVSALYGLGSPTYYRSLSFTILPGDSLSHVRDKLELAGYRVSDKPKRGEYLFKRGILEIFPSHMDSPIDVKISRGVVANGPCTIYPSSHHMVPRDVRDRAIKSIEIELSEHVRYLYSVGADIEASRVKERTEYDLSLIREVGSCKGIENYSRHFDCRAPGEPPKCLIDHFPKDYLMIVDESHQTLPQIRAMYGGDRARKRSLVEYGFRLPSAFDNRPLTFDEFYKKISKVIYLSATPGEWEIDDSNDRVIHQIIRPTGLLDPIVEIRDGENQIDNAIEEIFKEKDVGRIFVTTTTKKLAEDFSSYLLDLGLKTTYLHSDIVTLERMQILDDLRDGVFDILVGVNLLREGLDIPEVSLVIVLNADEEGFLRSESSLLQIAGRAARNLHGRVILYGHRVTRSMKRVVEISNKRRKIQEDHNEKHGIAPRSTKRNSRWKLD